MIENNFIEIDELTKNFLKYKNDLNKLSHKQIEELKTIIANRHKSNYKYINLQTLEVKTNTSNNNELEKQVTTNDNIVTKVNCKEIELTENKSKIEQRKKAIISSSIFDALFIALVIVSVIIIFILIFFIVSK